MNSAMRQQLEDIAQELIDGRDAAHDFDHARRVMRNAIVIGETERADEDVLVPAALFHDVVMYPKNDPRSASASAASAEKAAEILARISDYPHEKIARVVDAILSCSFSNASQNLSIEARVLKDADRLEATGAIAIIRTFWSAGQMKLPLYNSSDPLARNRAPDGLEYGLDLFFTRLLRVPERMNTEKGRQMAVERSAFLDSFVEQFESEWGTTTGE